MTTAAAAKRPNIEDMTAADFAVAECVVSAQLHVARRKMTGATAAEVFERAAARLSELAAQQ